MHRFTRLHPLISSPLGSNLQRTQLRFEVDSLAGPCAHSDLVMSRQTGNFLASHLAAACKTVNVGDLKPSACRGTGALKPGKTFLLLQLRTCTGCAGHLRRQAGN